MDTKLTNSIDSLQRSLLFYIDVDNLKKLSFTQDFLTVLNKFKCLTADIFACYNFFEDFPENTFLNKLYSYLKERKETSLDQILCELKELTQNSEQFSKDEIFVTILIFLYLFLQEATYGPSFFYIKETEKVDFNKDIHKFNEHSLFKLENSFESIKNDMIAYLTINGEYPYSNMKLLIFFIIAYELIYKCGDQLFPGLEILKLWKARILFLHNKMLKDPVIDIQIKLFELLDSFDINVILEKQIESHTEENKILNQKIVKNNKIITGLHQLEKSYYSLRYYKYKKAETLIEEAKNLFDLNINLTGKLGRRTKFQDFDSAILVVESQSSTLDKLKLRDDEQESEKPQTIALSEENPLLESPNITDDTFLASSYTELSLFDQMYVTALINHLKFSQPDEDLLREVILAYAGKSLEKSHDWLVYSKLLLQKALGEDKKTKTIERCLLQIQSLCDQYNDRSPEPFKRLKYCFIIDYPFIWNMKKSYAEMFMKYGAVLTAFDIFNELSMYEECIQCLYIAGKTEKALEFAESILKNKEDPGIYCVLGEIQNNVEYYFKALKVSNNKYTRAFRCLGKYYLVKNNLEESLKYYLNALEINSLFPNIWFTVGCIYIRQNKFEEAINSFSKSVSIDDTNSEGWANLGISFAQIKKNKEALKCLEEGLKRQRSNWKICENMLMISIEAKNLNKLIYTINHLFSLDKYEIIKPTYFYGLTTVFLSIYHTLDDKQIDIFKGKIYEIFEKFSNKDGTTPEIWDLYALFVESSEIEVVKDKIDEKIKSEVYHAILEIRLKQIRSLMIADIWEKEEKMIEKISKVITKIHNDLEKVNKPEVQTEVRGFISGIQAKIEKFYKLKNFNK